MDIGKLRMNKRTINKNKKRIPQSLTCPVPCYSDLRRSRAALRSARGKLQSAQRESKPLAIPATNFPVSRGRPQVTRPELAVFPEVLPNTHQVGADLGQCCTHLPAHGGGTNKGSQIERVNLGFSGSGRPRANGKPLKKVGGEDPNLFKWFTRRPGAPRPQKSTNNCRSLRF